ncbi:MAG: low molecular weight phosphotyrosine protein phosphatase [Lewinellaceae bacterium]|nr:low molecular weight phosphotyrosine protein phosphatase [Saprospiraceae bacterium]MCB9312236.1 low molecular weight phosphotyrosine protein phosphatase [Lewinellaceae bacterium]HRW75513.1 low molecular weight protein-tyrosine-phosphatase [Saprospiraceae bacterium]
MKILMVCLGNICRSPLAEGIFRRHVETRGLDWTIDSAGTGSWHAGERPDPRSIRIAERNGLDISTQRARQVHPDDFMEFNLIFAMDKTNLRHLLDMREGRHRGADIHLFLDYAHPGTSEDVPDPYWDDQGFARVYHMLDEASGMVIERIIREIPPCDQPELIESRHS